MSNSLQVLLLDFLYSEVVLENPIVDFTTQLRVLTIAIVNWIASGFATSCMLAEVFSGIFIWKQVVLVVTWLEFILVRTLVAISDVALTRHCLRGT